MAKAGSDYVEEAAAFFRTLGLSAEIERKVEGARGKHDVDVWVTGKMRSFDVRWMIECKNWKRNIPKEKVLALQAIAQDVGADRAFLLSETGFQAGAVRCARLTNITLTSLADLREQTREQFAQATVWSLYLRAAKVIKELDDEPVRIYLAGPGTGCMYHNPDLEEFIRETKQIEKALLDALRGRLPVTYSLGRTRNRLNGVAMVANTRIEWPEPLIASSLDDLICGTQALLMDAEQMLTTLRSRHPDRQRPATA